MQCSKSHKLSGGQRVKLLGLLLTKHKFLVKIELDAKNETILEKFQNNKCEIVNPQRFVVCEQTLPAENGKTHFMGKNAKQSEKSLIFSDFNSITYMWCPHYFYFTELRSRVFCSKFFFIVSQTNEST